MVAYIVIAFAVLCLMLLIFIPIPIRVFLEISLESFRFAFFITVFCFRIKPNQRKKKKGNLNLIKAFRIKKISIVAQTDFSQGIGSTIAMQSIATVVCVLKCIYLPKTEYVSEIIPVIGKEGYAKAYISATVTLFRLIKELIYGKNLSNS